MVWKAFVDTYESQNRKYFEASEVVFHYQQAVVRVGLWASEKKLVGDLFTKEQEILDLGCGAGRFAIGLWREGFRRLVGVDYSSGMVEAARDAAESLGYDIPFEVMDARNLGFEDGRFDAVAFAFNGLLQIPGHENRVAAVREVFRVLKPGGVFWFTGHDQALSSQADHWKRFSESEADANGQQVGDVLEQTESGPMFIRSATRDEMIRILEDSGFVQVESYLRQELANESIAVRDFADECRFWIARKP